MINNVLEEIKRLRVERFEHTNDPIKLTPKHFNMHKDTVANTTTKYYQSLNGEIAKTYHFQKSSYEDSLRKDTKQHFQEYQDTKDNNYMNKLFGVPAGLKLANNDNTLYYEKKLGKQSEFDFATKNWSNDINEKDRGLQEVLLHLNNKRTEKNIRNDEHSTITEYTTGRAKANARDINIRDNTTKIIPAYVKVLPAFNTPLPEETEKEETKEESILPNYNYTTLEKLSKNTLKTEAAKKGIILNMNDNKDSMIKNFISGIQMTTKGTTPRTPVTKK